MAINLNDNIKVNAGKPLDSKYLNGTLAYVSTAAVNAAIPIGERYVGLTVLIGTDEYWYQNGITNVDLIIKAAATAIRQIGVSVDGLGSQVQVGSLGVSVPSFSGTIQSWTVVGDVSGDIEIDVKVAGVSIIGAGNKPTIVAGTFATALVSGWTSTSIVANTPVEYEIIGTPLNFKRINLVLNII